MNTMRIALARLERSFGLSLAVTLATILLASPTVSADCPCPPENDEPDPPYGYELCPTDCSAINAMRNQPDPCCSNNDGNITLQTLYAGNWIRFVGPAEPLEIGDLALFKGMTWNGYPDPYGGYYCRDFCPSDGTPPCCDNDCWASDTCIDLVNVINVSLVDPDGSSGLPPAGRGGNSLPCHIYAQDDGWPYCDTAGYLYVRAVDEGTITVKCVFDDAGCAIDDDPLELTLSVGVKRHRLDLEVQDMGGCRTQTTLVTVTNPTARPVTWAFIGDSLGCSFAPYTPSGQTSPSCNSILVIAPKDARKGSVTVRATDCLYSAIQGTTSVPIHGGSGGCSGGACDALGTGKFATKGVHAELSLGRTRDGMRAGVLALFSDVPRTWLARPEGLQLDASADVARYPVGNDALLQQVKAPGGLAQIVQANAASYTYEVQFFTPGQVSNFASSSGEWLLVSGANPFARWVVTAPNASTGDFSRLVIQNYVWPPGGNETLQSTYVYQYSLSGSQATWVLEQYEGTSTAPLQRETTAVTTSSGHITQRTQQVERDGALLASLSEIYDTYSWGDAVVSRSVSTGASWLTSTYAYLDDPTNYPGLAYCVTDQRDADGSWVKYVYDTKGRVTCETRPWLDEDPDDVQVGVITETIYDPGEVYDPATMRFPRPVEVIRRVGTTIVGRTVYHNDTTSRVEDVWLDATGSSKLVTTTLYTDATWEKVSQVTYPNGRSDVCYRGYVDPTTFVAGTAYYDVASSATTWERTTVIPYPQVANQTTVETVIVDDQGRTRLTETFAAVQWVPLGGNNVTRRIAWTSYEYDAQGRMTDVYKSDGTHSTTVWQDCCHSRLETDATGVETTFESDVLGRVRTVTKAGVDPVTGDPLDIQPAHVTTYSYVQVDGLPGTLVRDGYIPDGNSPGNVVYLQATRTIYDLAGRVVFEQIVDPADLGKVLLSTSYAHTNSKVGGGREVAVTKPDGSQEITTYYRDGRVQYVDGSAVVGRHYVYGFAAGQETATEETGPSAAPRTTTQTRDMAGRIQQETRPAHPSGSIVTSYEYYPNGTIGAGQVYKVESRYNGNLIAAPTITEFDSTGRAYRTGLKVTSGTTLTVNSLDRITDNLASYVLDNGVWWRVNTIQTYGQNSNGTPSTTPTTISKQEEQLTGLPPLTLRAWRVTDASGLATTSVTTRDTSRPISTVTTTYPDGTSEVETSCAGVAVCRRGRTLSATSPGRRYQYDGIGRWTRLIDERGNLTQADYNALGQVESVTDATNAVIRYAYHEQDEVGAGQVKSIQNPGGKYTYFAYTARGELEKTWGDVPQPTKIEYTAYGERWKLHTYRTDAGWTAATWPANAGDGDVTLWTNAPATGLMTRKTDASGKYVDYTYTADGHLYQRIWARHASSQAATTYSYDPLTGELSDIVYDDATTSADYPMTPVHYVYDRLGRVATRSDAAGTHTFAYNVRLQPTTETITGTFYGATITLHQEYQAAATYRVESLGVNLGDSDVYATTYMYEDQKPTPANTGRLWRVTGPGLPDYGAEYSYVTGSDLVSDVQFKHNAGTIIASSTRTYEPNRSLLGKVANTWQVGDKNISTYDHFLSGSTTVAADALGRRTSLAQTGEVFPSSLTKTFGYNDRNELTSAYLNEPGTTFNYAYDSIGNRTNTSWSSDTEPPYTAWTGYTTNNLNQYRQIEDNVTETPPYLGYDDDGNLTRETAAGRLDMNCDGVADSRDLGIFMNLLSSGVCKPASCPAWYTQQYPWCDCYWADLNGDNCLTRAGDRSLYSQYLGSDYAVMLYTWDGENRLRAVANKSPYAGSPKEEYQYDALGRRIERKVFWWTGNSWSLAEHKKYVWASRKLLLELSVPTTGAPTVARKYTWGLDLAGLNGQVNSIESAGTIGGLLAVDDAARSGDRIAYFYDANGNVTEVLNLKYMGGFTWDSARLLAHYEYDPYGNRTNAIPAGEYNQPWRFSTKQFSTYTGLGYWDYRYYSPRLGRWISQDPLSESGSLVARHLYSDTTLYEDGAAHVYGFVSNAPYTLVDPDGLEEKKPETNDELWSKYWSQYVDAKNALQGKCDTCCACKASNGTKGAPPTEAAVKEAEERTKKNVKKCKDDAEKIVQKIARAWHYNYGKGKNTTKDQVGGYLCWDWEKGFRIAANSVTSGMWSVIPNTVKTEDAIAKKDDSYLHYFITLAACKKLHDTACHVMIDDGWYRAGKKMVHEPPYPEREGWGKDTSWWDPDGYHVKKEGDPTKYTDPPIVGCPTDAQCLSVEPRGLP